MSKNSLKSKKSYATKTNYFFLFLGCFLIMTFFQQPILISFAFGLGLFISYKMRASNNKKPSLLEKFKKLLPKIDVKSVPNPDNLESIRLTPPQETQGEAGEKYNKALNEKLQKQHWGFIGFGEKTWFHFKKDPNTKKPIIAEFAYGGRQFKPLTKSSAYLFHGLQLAMQEPHLVIEPESDMHTTGAVRISRYA